MRHFGNFSNKEKYFFLEGKNAYYEARKWYPKLCSLIKKSSKRHGFNLRVFLRSQKLKCIWIIKPSICSWPFDLSILWGNDCPDPPRWNYYSWAWFLSVTTMSRAPWDPPYVLVLLLLLLQNSSQRSSASLLWLQFSMQPKSSFVEMRPGFDAYYLYILK